MLQIIDISSQVLLDKQKTQSKFLTIINATVSHELRNPLNAIIALNLEKDELYSNLDSLLNSQVLKPHVIIQRAKIISKKLKTGQKVSKSAASLIQYMIQDLLDYSQINQGKFRKNMTNFNIIDTLKEVISIQHMKADSQGIKLEMELENIGYETGKFKPLIYHDEHRIK